MESKLTEMKQQILELTNENQKLTLSKQQFSEWLTTEKQHLAETMTELVEGKGF